MKYPRIARAVFESPWAILPAKLDAIVDVVESRALDLRIDADLAERYQAAVQASYERAGSVAVIPVRGIISKRMNMMAAFSGGTSTDILTQQVRAAANADDVSAIVLDIDSPGGSVHGVQEVAEAIYQARASKPIVAIANPVAASAAYWIGSAASELSMIPSGEAGSIGVIAMHVDQSKFNEQAGFAVTYITAGQYKAEGNPHEPLGDEALAFERQRVNEYYEAFIEAVARNRGVSVGTVRDDYGQGRVYGARQALAVGMVDRIETLDEVIRRLQPRQSRARLMKARTEFPR